MKNIKFNASFLIIILGLFVVPNLTFASSAVITNGNLILNHTNNSYVCVITQNNGYEDSSTGTITLSAGWYGATSNIIRVTDRANAAFCSQQTFSTGESDSVYAWYTQAEGFTLLDPNSPLNTSLLFDPEAANRAYDEMFAQSLPTMFGQSILGIIGYIIALIGLGWGIRKFQKHVSGKKF